MDEFFKNDLNKAKLDFHRQLKVYNYQCQTLRLSKKTEFGNDFYILND